mmetsp:Transcript_24751/g.50214  ORF Transcript_24751/g.50214 Transcript_24751/m.50214 type:complete len:468 (-) Transcript_24751:75-1478(-)
MSLRRAATTAATSTLGGRSSAIASRSLSAAAPKNSWSDLPPERTPVLVDAVRLPFAKAQTKYADVMAVDLQRMAIKGLMDRTALDGNEVDHVICGTVIQETRTSNIAREAAIGAGLPSRVGAHTVSMACISSNAAICSAAEKVLTGRSSVVVAGGVETFSDVPIRISRPLRKKLLGLPAATKKGGPLGAASHLLSGLRLSHLSLETPAIANYTTGEVMGVSSDRLSATFGVSREEQDDFAARSHNLAAAAHSDGWYDAEVLTGPDGTRDENGIKGDTTSGGIAALKPAFVKPHGTHTAANSSFLSDGSSAALVTSEARALELGLRPLAYLRDWSFGACDPFEEMLLGPTYCSHEVLTRNSLSLDADMDVLEIHEAFAGQVLSNLTAMSSQKFADEKLNGTPVGTVDHDKLNLKGGSLSIGHPFGATGTRLVGTAARRLVEGGGRFALVAACADGGCGHASILERYDG